MPDPSGPSPSPLRILILDLSIRYGGGSARALGLLEGFDGAAELACLAGSPVQRMARSTGRSIHVVARRKSDPRIPLRLRRLIETTPFQVVDTQNPQSKLHATVACTGTRVALVSTLNSWYPLEHEGRLKGRLYGAIERFTKARTDAFVAVAPEILSSIAAAGIDPTKTVLVPNAVAADDGSIAHDVARRALQDRFGFPAESPIVCTVGRLVEAKGLDVLLDAVATIVPAHPAVRLLVVGSGHLRDELETRVDAIGLRDRVRFAGFLDQADTATVVAGSDVFVMASRTEGLPIALLEAAAAARPIIGTAVGGIPAALDSETEALLVPPGDVQALADAIGRLIDDATYAAELGARAKVRVSADFGRKQQIERMREVYEAAWRRRLGAP
jgi:glycosyltransferase involved in cell wall biosynthesis